MKTLCHEPPKVVVHFRLKVKAQLSDFQFALKCSRPSSLPAQGLVGLAQSALRHLQNHGGQKNRRWGNEGFTFARFGKADVPTNSRAAKPRSGNLILGSREIRFSHEAEHQTSSLNNLLIKCYKCDHFLLQHSFQKNLPMPDNLKHTGKEKAIRLEPRLRVQLVYNETTRTEVWLAEAWLCVCGKCTE